MTGNRFWTMLVEHLDATSPLRMEPFVIASIQVIPESVKFLEQWAFKLYNATEREA